MISNIINIIFVIDRVLLIISRQCICESKVKGMKKELYSLVTQVEECLEKTGYTNQRNWLIFIIFNLLDNK